MLDVYPGMTVGVWQHRPWSLGTVTARSADPFADPIIQPNYLDDERDRAVLLSGMRTARRLLQTPELARFEPKESLPGPEVRSDDEMLDFARRYGELHAAAVGRHGVRLPVSAALTNSASESMSGSMIHHGSPAGAGAGWHR